MDNKSKGLFIEEMTIRRFNLDKSNIGFDASYNGVEIEIKACAVNHKNGVTLKGVQKQTKGRFWIDNHAHRILLDEKGLYLFALYVEDATSFTVIRRAKMFAFELNRYISNGNNTKIRYDLLFPDYKEVDALCP